MTERTTGGRFAGRLALLAWFGLLVMALLALQHVGHGQLSPPPLDRHALTWLTTRPPDVAAFALLRWVALVLAGYLLMASVGSVLAQMSGRLRLIRLSDMVTPAALRGLVAAAIGLSLTTASLVVAAPAMATTSSPTTSSASTSSPMTSSPTAHQTNPAFDPPPTIILLPPLATVAPSPVSPSAVAPAPVSPSTRPTPVVAPIISTWLVRPGDNFWSIARSTLAADGRPVTPADVVKFWRLLIAQNSGRLRHRGEPSWIYPGQRFDVPPPD